MHNKEGMKPLDSKAMSGKMIDSVIKELEFDVVKTNLFEGEYLPGEQEAQEAAKEWHQKYITKTGDVIVLLGKWVQENFDRPLWCKIVNIPHPASCMGKASKENYIKTTADKIKMNGKGLNPMGQLRDTIQKLSNEPLIDLDSALKLRGFFAKNDASLFEHWAYSVFDRIVKRLKNKQPQTDEEIEQMAGESWERQNRHHSTGINPYAYHLGYKAAIKESETIQSQP
jgi:hypothetical protein